MIKNNYFSDNEDMMLHFEQLIDAEAVINEYENGFEDAKKYAETGDEKLAYAPNNKEEAVEYYRTILESYGDLTGNYLSQVSQKMDHTGLKFKDGVVTFPPEMIDMWEKFKEAGLLTYSLRRENTGLGIPVSYLTLAEEIMARGDISFTMVLLLLNSCETLERYGSEEQKQKWLPKLTAGEYTCGMALTEPDFGSDLSSVTTRAEKQADGTYKLYGTKRFISQGCGIGDAPCMLLTLARTGKEGSGARGLSFFIVDSSQAEVGNIEHKMGIKCSATCDMIFDGTPAEIIGKENHGLTKYAMGMMNGARLGVGTMSVGLSTAAYEEAKKYAEERIQFGKPIIQIPAVKKMLDKMEREVLAMRCLNMEAARSIDNYKARAERMLEEGKSEKEVRKDEVIKQWEKVASILTPFTKLYCSEKANELGYLGVQVHGGAGFIEEYDIPRIYRDARILSIYEGTSQLQVVAAIGGIVAGLSDTGALRKYITEKLGSFPASAESKKLFEMVEESVRLYKGLETKEERDYHAGEVVWITLRFITGLCFEETAHRVSGDKKDYRAERSKAFNVDSIAFCTEQLTHLKAAAGQAVA